MDLGIELVVVHHLPLESVVVLGAVDGTVLELLSEGGQGPATGTLGQFIGLAEGGVLVAMLGEKVSFRAVSLGSLKLW